MAGRLEGKVVFITGIARGQGRSHAVRFAEEGADVIGIDICEQISTVEYPLATKSDLEETVRQVEALDRRIVVGQADVRDRASMEAVLDTGLAELGRLDFVLANAGIMPIWGEQSRTMQAWHDCLDVLLTGVLNTVELTYPHIVEQGRGGAIVITSSMAGVEKPMMRTESSHTLGMLGYTTAKSALKSLMRNYASLLAAQSIRVNSVHPTGVKTGMIENDLMANYFESTTAEDLLTLVNAMPIDAVDPVDISNMMVFLCSDEARYFTGHVLRVDAGADLR
ncbi:mycofactocin-coupled SDR family oxidoreductase [Jatrophihabitans sp.]|uniref:mycofactocin-coupled SDR family oxidoreductase n=1 Tax=Jatrophihabitans sp. TaxID=1932789 RepID=UPI0030C71C0A|nr:putative oxidoreductase [Jatrophihabitans sp.]